MKKNLLREFFFIALISVSISLATIVVHELGHFFAGISEKCDPMKIILIDSYGMKTYTEMECPETKNLAIKISFGGLFTGTLFALLFYIVPVTQDRYFSLIVLGFNFIISSYDLLSFIGYVGFSALILLGGFLITLGEVFIIDKKLFGEEK